MIKNMGTFDRIARVLIAAAIGLLYLQGMIDGVVAYVALALAAIFVLTSLISFCPLYLPFKFSSKKETK